MPTTMLVPLLDGLEITAISETSGELLVHVTSNCSCSVCSTPSYTIRSYYYRKPADLSCARGPLQLLFIKRGSS